MLTLPQPFRDAIAITRKLGFKYLWIDSLCIIQNQREDWEVEVALMGDIFANAFCTVAAASSPSSFDGCRIRSDSTKRTRFIDATFGDKRVRIFERCPEDWNCEYVTNPLQKRAWVLQERLLSWRTVIFSTNMLLWECATAKASGQLPWLQMRVEDPPKILLLNDDNEMDAGNETFARREAWFKTIESYTQMDITKEQDRLPAIAGLVTKAKHHGICVAGMWAHDMPSALLWHTESPSQCDEPNAAGPRRPTQKRAPSWSWAAAEGEISYGSQVRRLGASILISGLIQTGIVEKLRPSDACSPGHKLVTTNGLDIGIVLPDVTKELGYGTAVCCLPVRRDPYWAGVYIDTHALYGTSERNLWEKLSLIMGLVLQRIEGEDGTFRRCGLLRVARKDRFEGCPKRKITII
ncbi:hypothetical protein LTR70_007991 [Exophiala xenobiotica]|uniref:Heterokaryon incompatibility domain-containing protein n=1 Tax=Lithohypha guttulata TaxID=1690604 RepID=A0ABR0KLG2_9EURO|nr:hypothetical protein LTR24_001094 [Lithohypha guttulata]KAK5312736.1 hypothetical protein LTR70_007991 [Exophiala xenobiotica]